MFKLNKILSLLLLAAVTYAPHVKAESFLEKKKWAEFDTAIADNLKYFNETCGAQATFEVEKPGFANWPEDYSLPSFCGSILNNMGWMCSNDAMVKPEIASKVKKVVCKFGGTGKRSLTLVDGTVTWTVDVAAPNDTDFIKENLEKAL